MTISEFCQFYNLTRRQVEYRVGEAFRLNGGRFELPGFGMFQATKTGAGKTCTIQIEMWEPARARSADPVADTPSEAAPDQPAPNRPAAPSAPVEPIPDSPLAELSEHDLKRRHLAARIEKIEQETVLARARFRDEVVSYCASVFQLIIASLRSRIGDLRLDEAQTAAFQRAVAAASADIDAVLPDLIAGVPSDKVELKLNILHASGSVPNTPDYPESSPVPTTPDQPESSHISSSPAPNHAEHSPASVPPENLTNPVSSASLSPAET